MCFAKSTVKQFVAVILLKNFRFHCRFCNVASFINLRGVYILEKAGNFIYWYKRRKSSGWKKEVFHTSHKGNADAEGLRNSHCMRAVAAIIFPPFSNRTYKWRKLRGAAPHQTRGTWATGLPFTENTLFEITTQPYTLVESKFPALELSFDFG